MIGAGMEKTMERQKPSNKEAEKRFKAKQTRRLPDTKELGARIHADRVKLRRLFPNK